VTQILSGFPAGFNDLVGNNNFGEAPRQLSDVVVPTVEIGDQYLASRQVVAFNPGTGGVANGANGSAGFSLTIPTGEIWRVYGFSALVSTGAGDTLTAQPIITVDGGTTAVGPSITLAASQQRWAVSSQTPFWARSGTRFSLYGSEVVGGPTAALTVLCTRLKG